MAKDKRINELPGISNAAVVALNRAGIVSVHDLLSQEFDRVAYVVEDYNEAARLVKEARKMSEGRRMRGNTDSLVPAPLSGGQASPRAERHHARAVHAAPAAQPSSTSGSTSDGALGGALSLAARGLNISGQNGTEARASLARRLSVAAVLLEHGGSESEISAAVLLEAAEGGTVGADDIASRCGEGIGALLEECGSLRAVPILPTGKPPRYYLDMARGVSREARRVCAAHLFISLGEDGPPAGSGPWYYRLLLEALEAGGPDELVSMARAAVEGSKRAAA
jgi:hypothetical protein